jgi:cell division protein FtsZ
MSDSSSMLLIGVGTSGAAISRGVRRAFGEGLRYLIVDTDASSGQNGDPFALLGGSRLSGRGAGGDVVAARLAAEDSIQIVDEHLEGVRLAVIVTSLGGGTGGGATLELTKHLAERGIHSIVFATLPFSFEGENRHHNARGIMLMIEESANATFFLPLDKLIQDVDVMEEAMKRATDTVASGVTLFWRLVEKPGYLKLDTERIRHLLSGAGRGRFAAVTTQGPDRAASAVDQLIRSELLATASSPVNAILCGVLAGEDLRLSEIGTIADGIRGAFGNRLTFDLATVNDESTFSGRLCVVTMLFEASGHTAADSSAGGVIGGKAPRKNKGVLGIGPTGRGRFNNAEQTIWNGEDLDIPTFIRHNINLDY